MMKMASLFQSLRLGRGAFLITLALGIATAVHIAFAQELLPELAAPAAQYKAAGEALDKQKLEAIALAAKSYVSTLDSIEKAATAKGEIDLVAAVVKEREAVAAGTLEPNLPAALPKTKLQMSRKTLLATVERINTDFAKRKTKADADYLRVLATLQPKAASNPELAKQLAAEKAAVLQGGAGSGGSVSSGAAAKVSRGKNAVVNGDFEKIGADGKPEGWETSVPVTVETDSNKCFVRLKTKPTNNDGTADDAAIHQEMALPKGVEWTVLSVRARVSGQAVGGKDVPIPRVALSFRNRERVLFRHITLRCDGKRDLWQAYTKQDRVPAEAVSVKLMLGNGRCPGQVDFDDIEVTFK